MRDDEFEKAVESWAEAEVASAPDLRPTPDMHRLLRTRQKPRRALPVSPGWAIAGATAAGLFLIVSLVALLLRPGFMPGTVRTPAEMLIAQREGPGELPTAVVKGGDKGSGGKGGTRGPSTFRQLVLEIQRHDSPVVQVIDLLDPPEQVPAVMAADNYRLLLEPVEENYVYVYQLTASGNLVQIFPNPAYSAEPNPLRPGQSIVVPAAPNWLYLDGPAGEERLVVIASPQPLQALDDLYAQYIREPGAAGRRELLSALLAVFDTLADTPPEGAIAVDFVFPHR